uniref:Uncharacterized protein n=1 Tax=Timema bartmani TaxID=61472 RepID=A0A7R9EUN0_9NEOP|nr:unnamed protein product [Timema bartmani]
MQACVLRLDEYQFHEVRGACFGPVGQINTSDLRRTRVVYLADINHVTMIACHTTCHVVYSSADNVTDQSTDCGQDLQRTKTQSCHPTPAFGLHFQRNIGCLSRPQQIRPGDRSLSFGAARGRRE